MHDSTLLDEIDLRIIHAMQVQPRAPWALIGSVVGIDPVTAARRWTALTESGTAWIAAYPAADPSSVLAFVELRCEPGRLSAIVSEVITHAHVLSVNVHSGRCNVMLEALFAGHDSLAHYVLDDLHSLAGVTDVIVLPVTRVFTEGSRWRLGALEPDGVRRLRESGITPPQLGRRYTLEASTAEVVDVLSAQPRISITELAAALGISATSARRRLNTALSQHTLLRCEVARFASGRPVHALYFARSSVAENSARILRTLSDIRLVATVAGPANVIFAGWFPTLSSAAAVEADIAARTPSLEIVDRRIVLDTPKLMGHLLDRQGSSTGVVPVRVSS